MTPAPFTRVRAWVSRVFPGLMASVTVAAAATFLSQHYSAPVMLYALLLGMAMNFLSDQGPCMPGLELATKHLLRAGVALLGLRITYGQIAQLGWHPVLLVLGSVTATIGFGMVAARLCGFKTSLGVLTGGAVAICGASAALAIASVLPNHPLRERATLFTVVGVSMLSTLAMILYPIWAHAFAVDDHMSGIFLGATIHDVAQVVGAGYAISVEAGDTATVVKLLRVLMLVPIIVLIAAISNGRDPSATRKSAAIPWFVVAFVGLMLVASFGVISPYLQSWGSAVSRWFLVIAIAAIGIKTKPQDLVSVGVLPFLLMLAETAFLALLVMGVLVVS